MKGYSFEALFLELIGYTAAGIGLLVAVYVVARLIFAAWFFSKMEQERNTNHGRTESNPRART